MDERQTAVLHALTAVHEANERREIILPTNLALFVWEALLLANNGDMDALKVAGAL